jgi:DNA helicase-2/ATP-dependent DNA helicase PcrA
MEENLFPSGMSINTREELEEERRLFYVAITRAKSKLYLSFAINRYRFGQLQCNEPSRFIEEIDPQCIERAYSQKSTPSSSSNSWMQQSAFDRMRRGMGQQQKSSDKTTERKIINVAPLRPPVVNHTPTDNFTPSDPALIQAGQTVEHQKFGFGIIEKIEGAAHNPIATVRFKTNGEKKIMLNYAKLRIVE